MKRRDLIKFIGTAGMGSMLPYGFSAFAASPVAKLPVPVLLKADANGKIHLRIQKGQTRWWRKPTATWGYNGALLGPALWVKREQKISFEVENALDEDTSIHWHGLEIPGMADGGPQSPIQPGAIWRPELTIDQPAATCWFHPHPHGKTGRHVAMGLAGLLLINDEESRRLPLPENWGVDDIPVIFQDKRFNAHDQIDYKLDIVSAAVGWFGDVMLINGAIYPQHSAPRGWLRLRLLNGCNARHIRVAASDKRPLYVIAGDGGFLAEPVKVADLRIFAGERFEVLVDLRDGKPFDLISLPVDQMGMTLPPFDAPLAVLKIVPSHDKGLTTLPDRLVTLPPLPSSSALQNIPARTFRLSMDPRLDREGMAELMERYGHKAMAGAMEHGSHGDMPAAGDSQDHTMDHAQDSRPLDIRHANFINDKAFVMDSPMVDIQRGRYERWIISGKGDMMLHPFHIHGTQFRILSENGSATPAHRRGFKDTVHVRGEDSEVLVHFNHLAPAEHMFMAHCHLLEHEDTGMMMGFTVSDSGGDKRPSA